MRRSAASVAALVLGACASVTDGPGATTPDPLELSTAIDTNPAPDVVEVALTAREAEKDLGGPKPTRVWTYNGTMPGPIIDAKVGDELVARFTNTLPEPTLVHWHGVRLPAAMDGTPARLLIALANRGW